MDQYTNQDIVAMLAVIYKKLDRIERKVCGDGSKSASIETYLKELKSEAERLLI